MRILASLVALCALSGACSTQPRRATGGDISVSYVASQTDSAQLRASAQRIVRAFAAEVARARGDTLAAAPVVDVRNTPQLIFFQGSSNRIVVPWWQSAPAPMRAVFTTFAGGDEAQAERLFRVVFNAFLVAHETGHWFQARAGQREATLYANEKAANELAVAFWTTQPGGEDLLVEVERLVTRAAESVPDPTPPGDDPVAYFGAHYQELGADPLKYGYYQFRFMRDAVRARSTLQFNTLVAITR